MNRNIMWIAVILPWFVIIGLAYLLFALPAPKEATNATATSTPNQGAPTEQKPAENTHNQPLSKRVTVTAPKPNTTVGERFVVAGSAPGNWFFEASFPIQVRDADHNVIGRTHASAQGEWMTTELVTFTSTVNIESGYKGPATLILMRDNPSGLPEHDDAVEIPIVIQ